MKTGDATRQAILDLVRREPGIHKSELRRALGFGWGTISYHLDVLASRREVKTLHRGRRLRLFPGSTPDEQLPYIAAMRQDVQVGILSALRARPEADLAELADELGRSRRLIRRHLTSLEEDGILEGPSPIPRQGSGPLGAGLEPYHR